MNDTLDMANTHKVTQVIPLLDNGSRYVGNGYWTRHNYYPKSRPEYLIISCCYGHSIICIALDSSWGGSNNQCMVANDAHRCLECEQQGRIKFTKGLVA